MTMWKTSLILTLVLFCGCRPGESPMPLPDDASTVLVRDAMRILPGVHPPARTRLHLLRDADDAFGTALTAAMRESGYAVGEFAKPGKGGKDVPPQDSLAFDYRLIESMRDKQLRVTLFIGDESLSRLYLLQESDGGISLVPGSYWVRKQ
jgi:hypothetical protein